MSCTTIPYSFTCTHLTIMNITAVIENSHDETSATDDESHYDTMT